MTTILLATVVLRNPLFRAWLRVPADAFLREQWRRQIDGLPPGER